jgi:hypothetical protein
MGFASYGRIFNAFGGKKKIFPSLYSHAAGVIKIARRAPLPLTINN